MTLVARLAAARRALSPVDPRFAIVWEDPAEPDGLNITRPTPQWLAAALAGGVLPPLSAYFSDDPGAPNRAAPVGPMTEEQAMEYLARKDLPARVFAPSNRPRFRIVPAAAIPTDRTFRDAWRLDA